MGYNLLMNEVYWGYNPLTNHLRTSWDIKFFLFGTDEDCCWEAPPDIWATKNPSYFPLYWLFNGDPFNGLLQSPMYSKQPAVFSLLIKQRPLKPNSPLELLIIKPYQNNTHRIHVWYIYLHLP